MDSNIIKHEEFDNLVKEEICDNKDSSIIKHEEFDNLVKQEICDNNDSPMIVPNEAADSHASENFTDNIIAEAMMKIKQEFEEHVEIEKITSNNETGNLNGVTYKSECATDYIISEDMIKEEEELERKALLEELELRKKIIEEEEFGEENCFKRLKLLLSRSSIYSRFMAKKLEKYEKEQKRIRKKEKTNQTSIQDEQPAVVNSKNGLKRKASNSSTLSLKKQKTQLMDVYKKNVANMSFEKTENDISVTDKRDSLTDSDIIKRQPSLLYGGLMRSYQLEGFEWLRSLYENGINGILADEMGLGKTIQTIAFISYLIEKEISGPFFICAPLSTVPNWCAEFLQFAPDIPTILYHGTMDEREELRTKILQKVKVKNVYCYPVVITSYQIALNDTPKLSKFEWRLLTVDEAHRIKNFECKLVNSLKRYNSEHRLLLTGTPLQNNLSELWSLLNFILPELFDDLNVFHSWFDISKLTQTGATAEIIAQEQEKQIVSIIHQILTPFLLRRTKSDVELSLPPKKEVTVFAPLTSLQKKYYTAVLNNTIRNMFEVDVDFKPEILGKRKPKKTTFFGVEDNKLDVPLSNGDKKIAVKSSADELLDFDKNSHDVHIKLTFILMCLRRICCHPYLISHPIDPQTEDYLINENLVKTSGKMLVLDSMLPELKKRGHKILIFTQFVSMISVLEDYCYLRNYKYNTLCGSMSLEERQQQLEEFKEESSFIFLISTKAGGLGINLVTADTVILYDSDWNPQGDLQAQDRCHRIGQTKPVVVYRLVVPNTCDERIINFANAKRKLEKLIIQKGRFASKDIKVQKAITREEMLDLLESSDCSGFVKTEENSVLSKEELEKLLDRSDMM